MLLVVEGLRDGPLPRSERRTSPANQASSYDEEGPAECYVYGSMVYACLHGKVSMKIASMQTILHQASLFRCSLKMVSWLVVSASAPQFFRQILGPKEVLPPPRVLSRSQVTLPETRGAREVD